MSKPGDRIYVLYGGDEMMSALVALSFHSTLERAQAALKRRAEERSNPGSKFEAPMWHELRIEPEALD